MFAKKKSTVPIQEKKTELQDLEDKLERIAIKIEGLSAIKSPRSMHQSLSHFENSPRNE